MTPTWEIREGDVLDRLREMPDESAHCVVTSPPYWGLRDYGTGTWKGGDPDCDHTRSNPREDHSHGEWKGTRGEQPAAVAGTSPMLATCSKCGAGREDSQIGLEATPEDYVARMVEVFREVRRVLRSDGTLWLNLGDSYAGSWGAQSRPDGKPMPLPGVGDMLSARQIEAHPRGTHTGSLKNTPGLKPKDLVGIPWRVAFALQADGWYLRSDIIWAKPNPMPESVRDRPTRAHEYLFLLAKSKRYHYDAAAIAEAASRPEGSGNTERKLADGSDSRLNTHLGRSIPWTGDTRNRRTVWTVTTQPFPGAHFATFPTKLIEPCIKAGTSEMGCCAECGAPWERITETEKVGERTVTPRAGDLETKGRGNMGHDGDGHRFSSRYDTATRTVGWRPTCEHEAEPVPCTVLDPFSGVATTGVVSLRLIRSYIGIELKPEFVKMGSDRIIQDQPLINQPAAV